MPVNIPLRRKRDKDNATWGKYQKTSNKQVKAGAKIVTSKNPKQVQRAVNTIYPSPKQAGHMAKTPKRSTLPAVRRSNKLKRATKRVERATKTYSRKTKQRQKQEREDKKEGIDAATKRSVVANKFRSDRTKRIVSKYAKKDKKFRKGQVTKTKPTLVLRKGVTNKKVSKQSDKLEKELEKRDAKPQERKEARKELYKGLVKRVDVPQFKKPKVVARKLKNVERKADKIESGKGPLPKAAKKIDRQISKQIKPQKPKPKPKSGPQPTEDTKWGDLNARPVGTGSVAKSAAGKVTKAVDEEGAIGGIGALIDGAEKLGDLGNRGPAGEVSKQVRRELIEKPAGNVAKLVGDAARTADSTARLVGGALKAGNRGPAGEVSEQARKTLKESYSGIRGSGLPVVSKSGVGGAEAPLEVLGEMVEQSKEGRGNLHYLMEFFNRFPAATQNAVAQGLKAANVDDFEDMDIPSFTDALTKGWNQDGAITGATFTEALGIPEQTAWFFDLSMDPLMFVGAGLAPIKSAQKALALELKLSSRGIDPAEIVGYLDVRKRAVDTGNFDAAETFLRNAAAERGIRTSKLNIKDAFREYQVARALKGKGQPRVTPNSKTRGENLRTKAEDVSQDTERIRERVRGIRRNKETVAFDRMGTRNETTVRPLTDLGQLATESSLRSAARNRRWSGDFELRAMTPLGTRLGGVKVPLPKDIPILPASKSLQAARASEAAAESRRAIENYDAQLADAERAVNDARARGADDLEMRELNRAVEDIRTNRDHAVEQIRDVKKRDKEAPRSRATIREYAEQRNVQRPIHEATRQSRGAVRSAEDALIDGLRRSGVQNLSEAESRTVVRYARMRQDQGGTEFWHKAGLPPLNRRQQHALTEVDKILRSMGRAEQDAGVLSDAVPDYFPRPVDRTPDQTRQAQQELGLNQNPGSDPTKARVADESTTLMSREDLADIIQEEGGFSRTRAVELADEAYHSGRTRAVQTTTFRRVLRHPEREVELTDLTPGERRGVDMDRKAPPEHRIFETTAKTVKLNPNNPRLVDAPTLSRPTDQIASLQNELNRLQDIPRYGSDTPWGRELREIADDLQAQLDGIPQTRRDMLPPAEVASYRAAARAEHISVKKALTAAKTDAKDAKIPVRAAQARVNAAKLSKDADELRIAKLELKRAKDRLRYRERKVTKLSDDAESLGAVRLAAEKQYNEAYGISKADYEKYLKDAKMNTPLNRVFNVRNSPDPETPLGMPGEKVNPHAREHVSSLVAELPDTRSAIKYDEDMGRIIANRIRSHVIKVHKQNEVKALSAVYGRDLDGGSSVAYFKDGTRVNSLDYMPVWDPHINGPSHYIEKGTGKEIPADQIVMPNSLRPSMYDDHGKPVMWMDEQGYEYVRPKNYQKWGKDSPRLGREMQEIIGPDRIMRTDALDSYLHELVWSGGKGGGTYNALFDQGLDVWYKKAMGSIRWGVTIPFLAYHFRNMISDAFQSLLADSGVIFHPISNASMLWHAMRRGNRTGEINMPGLGNLKMEDWLLIQDHFGLNTTAAVQEFSELMRGASSKGFRQGKITGKFWPGPKGRLGQRIGDYSTRRENIVRMITFAQRMRRNGGDVPDAIWHTTKYHFDYGNLSHFERTKIRNLFLFYTWYRNNIPLQMMSLISRPGFFAGISTTYEGMQEGRTPINSNFDFIGGPDLSGRVLPEEIEMMPEYMTDILSAAKLPVNTHSAVFAFGAPWADLSMLTNLPSDPTTSLKQIGAMTNPLFTTLLNQGYGVDALTGRAFNDYETTNPVIAKMAETLGMRTIKREDGSIEAPQWFAGLMNQVPLLGRAAGYTRADTNPSAPGAETEANILSFLGINMKVQPGSGPELGEAVEKRLDTIFAIYGGKREAIYQMTDEGSPERAKMMDDAQRETVKDVIDGGFSRKVIRNYNNTLNWMKKPADSSSSSKPDVPNLVDPSPNFNKGTSDFLSPSKPDFSNMPKKEKPSKEPKTNYPPDPYDEPDKWGLKKNWWHRKGRPAWPPVEPNAKPLPDPAAARVASRRARHTPATPKSPFLRAVRRAPGPSRATKEIDRLLAPQKVKKAAKTLSEARSSSTGEFVNTTLTPDQQAFARSLAENTGMSLRLAGAAVIPEGGNNTPGDHNWLNIGAFDDGWDQSIMGDPRFKDPVSAGKLTADFLKGKEFGASEGIQNIYRVIQAGGSDEEVGRAWAESGWASSGASPLDALDQVQTTPGKDIPRKEIKQAEAVLGKKAAKAIMEGGRLVPFKKAKKTKFKGQYEGSKQAVQFVVGSRVKADHELGGSETPGDHAAGGFHTTEDAYAQDINTPGGNPAENEPPYNQESLDTIVKNLRKLGADIPDMTLEQDDWHGEAGGFEWELLTVPHGSGPHIHIGARNAGGGSAPSGVRTKDGKFMVVKPIPTAAPTSSGTPSSGGTSTPTSSPKPKEDSPVRRRATARQSRPFSSGMSSYDQLQAQQPVEEGYGLPSVAPSGPTDYGITQEDIQDIAGRFRYNDISDKLRKVH